MKIYFATTFDSPVFYDLFKEKKSVANEVVYGPKGLLDFCELRLGLKGNYPDEVERIENYRSLIKKNITDKDFVYESFDKNQFEVAKDLLRYRDELLALNWTFDYNKNTPKLQFISKLENISKPLTGYVDRWLNVKAEIAKEGSADLNIEKLYLYEDIELIHPFYNDLIENSLKDIEKEIITIDPTGDIKGNNLQKIKYALNESNAVSTKEKLIQLQEDKSVIIVKAKTDIELADVLSLLIKDNPSFQPLIDLIFNVMGRIIHPASAGGCLPYGRGIS